MSQLQIILASIFGSAYFLGTVAVAIKAMHHGREKREYLSLYEMFTDSLHLYEIYAESPIRDMHWSLFQAHARMQRYCILIFVVLLIAPALVALNFAYLGA